MKRQPSSIIHLTKKLSRKIITNTSTLTNKQCGFALLEAGSVRAKNTKNILLKNVLDACLGAIIWWFMGFPIALGDSTGKFAGGKV